MGRQRNQENERKTLKGMNRKEMQIRRWNSQKNEEHTKREKRKAGKIILWETIMKKTNFFKEERRKY